MVPLPAPLLVPRTNKKELFCLEKGGREPLFFLRSDAFRTAQA
jgi:hypothetical protein